MSPIKTTSLLGLIAFPRQVATRIQQTAAAASKCPPRLSNILSLSIFSLVVFLASSAGLYTSPYTTLFRSKKLTFLPAFQQQDFREIQQMVGAASKFTRRRS